MTLMALPTLPPFLVSIFGAENPNRYWFMGFVVCALACLFRGTRRAGGIGLFVVAGMMSVSVFIQNAFTSFTPHH